MVDYCTPKPGIDELVERARAGDREAFGEIYVANRDRVHAYIKKRITGCGDADDLTSETFLRALQAIGRYREHGTDPVRWLFTIARNLITDRARRTQRQPNGNRWDTSEVVVADPAPTPDQLVVSAETLQILLTAIGTLNQVQAQCLMMRYITGMNLGEIAAATGKNTNATRAVHHRAVCRLRDMPEIMELAG